MDADLLRLTEKAELQSSIGQMRGNMSAYLERSREKGFHLRRAISTILVAGMGWPGVPLSASGAAKRDADSRLTEYFQVCHTVEYSGRDTQFRTQATGRSVCLARKGAEVADYELAARADVRVGNHEQPIGAKFKPLRLQRDPASEALMLPDGQAVLLVEIMNRVMGQVDRRGQGAGAWEQAIALGISRYMPDKIRLKFSGTPIVVEGLPDVFSLAVVSEPFSFEALEKDGPKTITGRFKAVFIYSIAQDRLYQMGASLAARRGGESLRVEYMAVQCDAKWKKILAPVADLSEFLGFRASPMKVEHEAPPPFWTRQACQAFQAVAMASATVGRQATNWALVVAETVNAVDGLWGAAASVVETVGTLSGVPEVEAWGKAMESVTPSKEIERNLAQVIGEKEAEYAMATVQLGAAYVAGASATMLGTVATVVGVGLAFHEYVAMPVIDAFWANEQKESDERFEKELTKLTQWTDADFPKAYPPPAGAGTTESRNWAAERTARLQDLAKEHPYITAGAGMGTVALVVAGLGGGGGGGGDGGGAFDPAMAGTYAGSATETVQSNLGTESGSGPVTVTITETGAVTFRSPLRQGVGTMSGNRFTIPIGLTGGSITLTGTVSGNQITGGWSGGGSVTAEGETLHYSVTGSFTATK